MLGCLYFNISFSIDIVILWEKGSEGKNSFEIGFIQLSILVITSIHTNTQHQVEEYFSKQSTCGEEL
jgi:hypothetical protein